jgi:hypothetical protein
MREETYDNSEEKSEAERLLKPIWHFSFAAHFLILKKKKLQGDL